MIYLQKSSLKAEICHPGEYYRGTRFDHAGVFRRIVKDDYVFADEWFSHEDPYKHDRVCGMSEEFVTVNFNGVRPGELFCKPGVGLLRRPDDAPYDWFHLYEIEEEGDWKVESSEDQVLFEHQLDGWYRYRKWILLEDSEHIVIRHTMEWDAESPLQGFFYNHNFFTFGGKTVGPSRSIRFPWKPEGDWRSVYHNVHFTPTGVAFTAPVDPANAVYCGNLHAATGETSCCFEVSDADRLVKVEGDALLDHIVLWSNNRVACIEPYLALSIPKGHSFSWQYRYSFQ